MIIIDNNNNPAIRDVPVCLLLQLQVLVLLHIYRGGTAGTYNSTWYDTVPAGTGVCSTV